MTVRWLAAVALAAALAWLPDQAAAADLGTYRVTAYCLRGRTASGWWVGPGTVAAPRRLPFGTRLWVQGYGAGVVRDRGGAVGPGRLDVWFASCWRARQWGVRHVRVWTR